MIWVFLPLMIVPFRWKSFDISQWRFTVYYLLYAISFMQFYHAPLSPYLGSFYLGIPAICYVSFLFPNLQNYYPESAVRMLSIMGLSMAFAALLYSLLINGTWR
ncbi:hypothetical protein SAMN02745781_04105 [Vibrio gazogenes DSM 21264]|uniref:Uncharacterized protein n=1 Tax=Vibrio gazogenes DSM 21264 = NBRC 103151 TaxID=1123492 RepID=A0A1M5HHZ9_VIBGA|nr:hypothetical protein SAMN02745781_04105 [Vibrio gazogenes DSM 21264] [Vibrio gazogenes DSM 21264 = NBRC 103151]SJN56709.1 hypothetical protein BQ6471_02170 [Vibrio gazogenes]